MAHRYSSFRSHLTLGLSTVLHGFTHAYGSMLVPLYYRIAEDLNLKGVGAATLIVTLYGAVYNLGSYAAGVASDRFSRKWLLAIGLFGNAAAIGAIGLSRDYSVILALAMLAGVFGTMFHPAANALVPSHYPKSPGMAIGILALGSGLGFFFGPQIAGWRAASASWHLWHVAQWQKPCVEMALAGVVVGIIFVLISHDTPGVAFSPSPGTPGEGRGGGRTRRDPHPNPPPEYQGRGNREIMPAMGRLLHWRIASIASVLMFRDFAGVAGLSLAAIYVRNVFHLTVEEAGLFVGVMMLPSVIINPLCVFLTPGRRRLPGLAMILIVGGIVAATAPLWPLAGAILALCAFQAMQMGSYAVSDASILERVESHVRGRVVGLFLLIAGTFGALGPWVMGAWVDRLGARAHDQSAYMWPFALLAACMVVAAASPRLIARLGKEITPIRPFEEISPETMGAVP